MSAFRSIVARRRPSLVGSGATEPSPEVLVSDAPASPPPMLADPIEAMRPPAHSRPRTHALQADTPPDWDIAQPDRTMERIGDPELAMDAFESDDPVEGEDAAELASGSPAEAEVATEAAAPNPEPGMQARGPETPAAKVPDGRIWDLEPATALTDAAPEEGRSDAAFDALTDRVARAAASEDPAPVPQHARGGRVRTRLLGFHADDIEPDLFAMEKSAGAAEAVHCPVGFLVIVDGPGFGTSFALAPGLSTLGRGEDQTVTLDFGDDSISRNNHASIAYDEEENQVLIGHGGKSNLVRLNGKPLVSTTELAQGDRIRIGKTTLRYVALCGPDFSWSDAGGEAGGDA